MPNILVASRSSGANANTLVSESSAASYRCCSHSARALAHNLAATGEGGVRRGRVADEGFSLDGIAKRLTIVTTSCILIEKRPRKKCRIVARMRRHANWPDRSLDHDGRCFLFHAIPCCYNCGSLQ